MIKAKITGKNQITIPKGIMNKMELEVGDEVEFKPSKDGIVISKIDVNPLDICPLCGNVASLSMAIVSDNITGQRYHLQCYIDSGMYKEFIDKKKNK